MISIIFLKLLKLFLPTKVESFLPNWRGQIFPIQWTRKLENISREKKKPKRKSKRWKTWIRVIRRDRILTVGSSLTRITKNPKRSDEKTSPSKIWESHLYNWTPSASSFTPESASSFTPESFPSFSALPLTNTQPFQKLPNGTYKANGPQVHWWQGSPEAAGHKGCSEICPGNRRCEEAPQVQTRNCCSEGNQEVPEEHRASDPKAPLPAFSSWNRSGLQDGSEVSEQCRFGPSGSRRGLPGWTLWRH